MLFVNSRCSPRPKGDKGCLFVTVGLGWGSWQDDECIMGFQTWETRHLNAPGSRAQHQAVSTPASRLHCPQAEIYEAEGTTQTLQTNLLQNAGQRVSPKNFRLSKTVKNRPNPAARTPSVGASTIFPIHLCQRYSSSSFKMNVSWIPWSWRHLGSSLRWDEPMCFSELESLRKVFLPFLQSPSSFASPGQHPRGPGPTPRSFVALSLRHDALSHQDYAEELFCSSPVNKTNRTRRGAVMMTALGALQRALGARVSHHSMCSINHLSYYVTVLSEV